MGLMKQTSTQERRPQIPSLEPLNRPTDPSNTATARYIAEMSAEMARMASGAGLSLVSYFLSMAHAEAEDAVERGHMSARSSVA